MQRFKDEGALDSDISRKPVVTAFGSIMYGGTSAATIHGSRGDRLEQLILALPWLLYSYLPRPPVGGAQFLVYPAMAGILAVFVMHFSTARAHLPLRVLGLLGLILLLNVFTAVSFLINASTVRIGAVAELFRPALFAVFLLFGYHAACQYTDSNVRNGLVLATKVVLVGQAVLASTQLAGVHVFDVIYSAEKARPLSGLARATGSFGNPNSMAWMVAQASVTLLLLGQRWRWVLLGAVLVFAAGSRTVLVFFPMMIVLACVWRQRGGVSTYAAGAGALILAFGAIGLIAYAFASILPYLAELRWLLLSGSLDSVTSFAKRLHNWGLVFAEFRAGGPITWVFGLGSRDMTRVLDNDYLYVLFRLGAVGLIIHFALVVYILLELRRGTAPLSLIAAQYLIFSLGLGLAFETLGGWNFPLILYFYTGIVMARTYAEPSFWGRWQHGRVELMTGAAE